ncbi:ATP-dependent DNA ligase [Membranicola marinus]|uniref:DNA ligase (ATP) n=1 Tax=Membranihabitans marinus TaxID=1227546 RepID=A0A953HRL4_9BACT|nr:ATP-dependent DNA ligase [Membranihabitans marinus]MBY5957006.1 ATP-dependent DNA ligase [Membranihabitans marinus]
MKHFSQLISTVEMTNKTNAKIDALAHYFDTAPDTDKLHLITLFTGKRRRRPVRTNLMREWCLEITGYPEWLFQECYSTVGDLGETIALILPQPTHRLDRSLSTWMSEIKSLESMEEEKVESYVKDAWMGLEPQERFIFNKLIGGSFRIGISKKTLVNGLAKHTGRQPAQLMHSLMGQWSPENISFQELVSGEHINYDDSRPYPFCLAYPIDKSVEDLGDADDWQAEYKWDGIRGQVVRRNEKTFIWSRGEELVTPQFPEIIEAFQGVKDDVVIDGEILPLKDGNVLLFNDLQKRLNRKNVTKKLLTEVPVEFYIYDCLEWNGIDIREKPLSFRRQKLQGLVASIQSPVVHMPKLIAFTKWDELHPVRENARSVNSEGLMLKERNSPYHTGRKKGDWWKWKVDPLTIDAVMIYAQRGHGRRSGHYTDYTLAVRDGDNLVTIAKAYSGLTDKEITEVSRFVRQNAIEKFGPVRTVKPELVFEIAFEGIALSRRHKSGVALRFPRIKRWRKDKSAADIDTLESVKQLIYHG